MNRTELNLLLLLGVGALVFGISLFLRRRFHRLEGLDTSSWSATLSYVATAYGVVVGFSIIFLFGEFSDARQATGDEATSVGTAFEEARVFPDDAPDIQHALICYGRAVPEYDWPALRRKEGAPEADEAYRDIIVALGNAKGPTSGTFQPAAATNIFLQIGNVSTARETRLVAAETKVPVLLWVLLFGGGFFVVALIFVVTLPARPGTQAILVALSAVFTAVMILIVIALSSPFATGSGRVTPKLIQQTTQSMEAEAPALAAMPCNFEQGG